MKTELDFYKGPFRKISNFFYLILNRVGKSVLVKEKIIQKKFTTDFQNDYSELI